MPRDSDIIKIDDLAYAELLRKVDVIYDYVSIQMEKYIEQENNRIVALKEVADYLKVDIRTVQRRVAEGKIPRFKDGRSVLFRLGDIKEAVNNRIIKTEKSNLKRLINKHTFYGYKRADTFQD